ncbi:unnamed protein product [Parnassius apollo]|uniref:(apollo) hypothetical protein n=1 Tax=Parnassius apollo TaxID=110799 RepID=A0A8S3WQN5_PARAO|nr:unnamed protein product [Parnassius apollo]
MWVVDPEVLIIEVEARPFLYAKTLPEYSNKIIKNNAWEDITKKLSEDWETLNNDEKNSRFPHVKDAKTSGNYSIPTNVPEQNTGSPSTFNTEYSPAGPSIATCNVTETPKKKKKTTSSFESEILKAIKNESGMDEDKTFCLSLVQSLKKMDGVS